MNMKLALYAAAAAVVSAKYPTEFPFGLEKNAPEALNAQTPALRFGEDDGGYVYYYTTQVTGFYVRDGTPGHSDGGSKFPGVHNGHFQFGFVNSFSVQPVLNAVFWNCTAKMINEKSPTPPFASTDFTGTVGAAQVCTAGECCKEFWDLDNGLGVTGMEKGMPKANKDQPKNHGWFQDRHAANQCGDVSEQVYCTMVEGDSKGNCDEFAMEPSVRLTILHCYDSWVKYLFGCAVFNAGAYTPKYTYEGADYNAASTIKQKLVVDSVSRMQDQICFPYSYYFADKATDEANPWTKAMTEAVQAIADDVYVAGAATHFEFTWMSPPPPATPTPVDAPTDDKKTDDKKTDDKKTDDKKTDDKKTEDKDDSASAQLMVAALMAGVMLYV